MPEQQKEQNESVEEMEPSIMSAPKSLEPPKPIQEPKTKEIDEEETYEPQSPQPEYQQSSQEYSPEQAYPQETYDYAPSYDSDIMIEIAEQVFLEKIKKLQKQVDEINEFKTLAEVKIENIADRLKRIETIIDKLQISILEKVGSYGKDLETTKKEMSMMQDSFRKVVNQPKEITKTEIPEPAKTKKISKKK